MRFAALLLSIILLADRLDAVESRTVEFAGQKFTVCTVDLRKEKLELFLNDDAGKPLNTLQRLEQWLTGKGRTLEFATNAGMYERDYSAVGLCIANGRQLGALNLRNAEGNFYLKPNAVFAVTDRGAMVVDSARWPSLRVKAEIATQSGPALVLGGKLHHAFREGSQNRLIRNGVGVETRDRVQFVMSEGPVNFHDFARLFRDGLKCPDAVFLDGTVSSLYSRELKRSDFRINLGPMIGVVRDTR